MKINHIGIWTDQLEKMREFYITFFNGKSNEKYVNQTKGFESYFISFDGLVSIEIMRKTNVKTIKNHPQEEYIGLAHFSFSVGDPTSVDQLTERLRQAGFQILSEPRTTGTAIMKAPS